jgi:hypothetical protein
MIGIIFSALFLGFFTGRFFLAPIAKPLLDTILMTALAVMVFCAGADIGSSRQIVRRFLTVKTLGLSLLVLLATNVGQSWRRVDHGVSYGSAFSGCPTRECWHGMVQPVFRPAQCRCGY